MKDSDGKPVARHTLRPGGTWPTLAPMHRPWRGRAPLCTRCVPRCAAVVLLSFTVSGPAFAQQWELGTRLGGSAERLPLELSQSRFVSETTLPETKTTGALRFRLFGEASGRPWDRLGLTMGLDTGLLEIAPQGVRLDRRPVDEQVQRTLLLGRVQAELQLGPDGVVALRAGRTRPRIGQGAVYDAYAFGVELDVDLSVTDTAPISFLARVLLPDGTFTDLRKTSPLLDLQITYRAGWSSKITLLTSIFFDTNSELSDPVRSALFKGRDDEISEFVDTVVRLFQLDRDTAADAVLNWIDATVDVDTEGLIAWTGLAGQFGDDAYSLRLTILGALGNLRVSTPPTPERVQTIQGRTVPDQIADAAINRFSTSRSVGVRAFFAELQARIALTDVFEVSSFALVLTGDRGLSLADENPRLSGFLGLSPLVPRTAVFFGGTFGPDQATPTAFRLAPDDSGILAAGASVAAYTETLVARFDAAVMTALVPSRFTGGRLYGVEIDAHLGYPIYAPVEAFVDGGILFSGSFFDDPAPAVQVVGGVQVFLQSDE